MSNGERCWWCGEDPLYVAYHDDEWGHPLRDERRLYEKVCLEGFQSGLAWITILRKREAFRRAFEGFDPERVAAYGEEEVQRLLADDGIIWVVTPKTGKPGHVQPAEIAESAPTAGLMQTSSANLGNWIASRLVQPKSKAAGRR